MNSLRRISDAALLALTLTLTASAATPLWSDIFDKAPGATELLDAFATRFPLARSEAIRRVTAGKAAIAQLRSASPVPRPRRQSVPAIDASFVDRMVANVALQFLDRVDRSPRNEAFRYPVADVRGLIKRTVTHAGAESTTFDLVGTAAGQLITLKGRVEGDGPDPGINLRVTGHNVPLDDSLFAALPAKYVAVAREFRGPGGMGELDLDSMKLARKGTAAKKPAEPGADQRLKPDQPRE